LNFLFIKMFSFLLIFFFIITFKKFLSSIYIIICLYKDFRNVNKNNHISWSECYKKNYIYTPGLFIYEIKKQRVSLLFFIFFIFSLLLIKIIVKVQIFFIFLFTILNKITVLNVKENSNVLYNLFIFIPYKTSFQINLKKFSIQNLYNLFINIPMNTLFF